MSKLTVVTSHWAQASPSGYLLPRGEQTRPDSIINEASRPRRARPLDTCCGDGSGDSEEILLGTQTIYSGKGGMPRCPRPSSPAESDRTPQTPAATRSAFSMLSDACLRTHPSHSHFFSKSHKFEPLFIT